MMTFPFPEPRSSICFAFNDSGSDNTWGLYYDKKGSSYAEGGNEMSAVSKNVTEIARHELEEELERYETPEECLEYLLDDSHFKTISQELVEVLQNVCGLTDRNTKKLIQFVAERIMDLENPDGYSKDALRLQKKVVARWFNKNVVPDRTTAIKICFALKLDYEKTKEFLRKGCKSYAFNVRNAEDAVYMYCLLNGRTYADAQALLMKYHAAEAPETAPAAAVNPSDSSTTQILLQALKAGEMDESTWENDDAFLQKFLVPNKSRFTGYARTAARVYYEQKQCLQERLIRNSIADVISSDPDLADEGNKAVIYHLLNTLRDLSSKHDEFSPLLSALEADHAMACDVWDDIMALFDNAGFKTPCDKGAFLDEMMPVDAMLRNVMHDLPYDRRIKDRDFASYRRSSLSDLVQGLTIKRGYEAFEKDPQKNTFTTSTRKIIMLMFYLNYIDGWTPDTDYDEKNYDLFFNELSDILDDCQFASLYHADPFDWLMLRSVIGIERYEPWAGLQESSIDADEVDPSFYFFEVLRMSFDSTSPERYLSRLEALERAYDQIRYERARMFTFGQISYGDRVQHSQSPNASFTYKVDASVDSNLSARAAEVVEQVKKVYTETVAAINTVTDPEERDILMKRYIEFKRFEDIADELKVSYNTIIKKHLLAIEHVDIPSTMLKEFEN